MEASLRFRFELLPALFEKSADCASKSDISVLIRKVVIGVLKRLNDEIEKV
jgi:hypothetical protein